MRLGAAGHGIRRRKAAAAPGADAAAICRAAREGEQNKAMLCLVRTVTTNLKY